ncbi:50S ribosomal protein L22 [Candidatus Woesearchaeota archaeon]|nr:50S ribosomal protein L22 [Candidatus Woesearchaeota archaeon]
MAQYKYAFQGYNPETMARAAGRDIAISTKQAIEISNYLRHKKLILAKQLMEAVTEKKHAVPFKRFTNGVGHRRGKIASGRYPVKAAKAILKLLESAETNAQGKGLNTKDLEVFHICAHRAHAPVHYGRHGGREFKRSHVEIVLKETEAKSKKEKKAAPAKKETAEKDSPKPESAAAKPRTGKPGSKPKEAGAEK